MTDSGTHLYIAKTFAGCEALLEAELLQLGAEETRILTRAVEFRADLRVMYRVNLCSRVALRVLKPVFQFEASSENMLYHEIQRIQWSDHFSLEQTFAIHATLNQSNMTHSLYVALKAKDAIVDQFRDQTGERPSVDLDAPDIRIHLHLFENRCTLSFDASGESLHKRGYRDYTNQAPINEALAAALVMQSGWQPDQVLADFMCGSGTLLIEAALMALNKAPNQWRKRFGFMGWNDFDEHIWKAVKAEALAAEKPADTLKLFGSDVSGAVIEKAKENIRQAGLQQCITLRKCSFEKFQVPATEGVLVCNPPYGLRIAPQDILELYRGIGDKMKKDFKGWTCWIFTGNLETAKFIGLRPSRKIHLYNGPIECRFLKFDIYEGSKKAAKMQAQ